MKKLFYSPQKQKNGVQDINEAAEITSFLDISNALRAGDKFRVNAIGSDSVFSYALLGGGSLGYCLKFNFINGRAWGESERVNFLSKMEEAFRLDSPNPLVNYSFAFVANRRQMSSEDLQRKKSPKTPLTNGRIDYLTGLADRLEVQDSEMYLSIVASPSDLLKIHRISIWDRIKMVFSEQDRLRHDAVLMEDVIVSFGDRIRLLLGKLARAGVSVECPRDPESLLKMMRDGWRPEYTDSRMDGSKDAGLEAAAYVGAAEYLQKELKITQKKSHWISDGCFHMLFAMTDAPNPSRPFMTDEIDRVLCLGLQPGVSMIPYTGRYIIAWTGIPTVEADKLFSFKVGMAQASLPQNKGGMFDDKMARRDARELEDMHNDFISGKTEMTNSSVMYQLSIPLQHLNKFFQTNLGDNDLVRTISSNVISQLSELGDSTWEVEKATWYVPWLSSIPGAIDSSSSAMTLPTLKMSLKSSLHLVPFFATVGPESPNDSNAWRGGNYFITDDAGILIFDHFSKNNGPAANFSICGATGSGKSVLCQSLAMMTEPMDPYIMILDFGGGNVGSWTKLASVMGGVELKFGSARPPRINPMQLAEADSFPNQRKKGNLCHYLGLDKGVDSDLAMIDSVYLWLRMEDSKGLSKEQRMFELTARCPAMAEKDHDDLMSKLQLTPGYARPGDKGAAAIRLVLELLLSSSVNADGPEDHVWGMFNQDDINEALTRLYEEYLPDSHRATEWPTLTSLKGVLEKVQSDRMNGKSRYNSSSILNYGLLMNRLNNYCLGGLDPFLDGQTNVDIRKKVTENGLEREVHAKFLLADMAGIADLRKLAIYMIIVNDFMSGILYNSKDSRGIMIRDEAWFFMNSQIASKYLEADYRLARKYGFSVITIAQQYSDFKNPVIQNNTQTWCVCNLTSKGEIDMAHARFRFNSTERDMFDSGLMGTRQEKNVTNGRVMEVYSRVLIANKSGKFFVKNKISNKEQWISTTDANETFVFNYYKDLVMRDKTPIEIIDWLCSGLYKQDEKLRTALTIAGRVMPTM